MSSEPPLPERIGKYQIIKRLGEGAFGCVYSALDRDNNRTVAIKMLLPPKEVAATDTRSHYAKLKAEYTLLASLKHPNVIAVHDSDLDPVTGNPYVVMEEVDGKTLAAWRLTGPDLFKRLLILEQVASAVSYLHGKQVEHRDLKPGNIMVELQPDEQPRAKVLDFGIAKRKDSAAGKLDPSSVLQGTPSYMAPEQLDPDKGMTSPASDVFAFGVVAYELLADRHPFFSPGSTDYAVAYAIIHKPHPPLEEKVASKDILAVINRCLEKSNAHRFPSMVPAAKELLIAVAQWRRSRAEELVKAGLASVEKADRERATKLLAEAQKVDPGCSGLKDLVQRLKEPPREKNPVYEELLGECRRLLRENGPASRDQVTALLAVLVGRYGWTDELLALQRKLEPATVPRRVEPRRRWAPRMGWRLLGGVLVVFVLLVGWRLVSDPKPSPPDGVAAGESREWRDGIVQRWVPPGEYRMGCSPGDSECFEDEKPPRKVRIGKGFWLQESEVTQVAYERVMGKNPSYFKGAELPVEQVSWPEAKRYCEEVGLRLPSEEEWEYAARGGTTGSRYGELNGVAWYDGNSGGRTHEVKRKTPNGYGLYDMLGNAWEWTASDYDASNKTLRGGSWLYLPQVSRASYRSRVEPGVRYSLNGFRCLGD